MITAFALAVAAIGGAALTPGTAGAADLSHVEDGFDNSPETRWTMSRTSLGGTATFGNSHASISAHQAAGWTAISRTVRVPAAGRHDCFAGVKMRTMSLASIRVNVEVIDPATFQYIALEEATVSGSEYRGYSASWRDGPLKDVLFRVSMLAADASRSIDVDTMMFVCSHQDPG
jgi:hypothetical protein